jgi:hypothetical protein
MPDKPCLGSSDDPLITDTLATRWERTSISCERFAQNVRSTGARLDAAAVALVDLGCRRCRTDRTRAFS